MLVTPGEGTVSIPTMPETVALFVGVTTVAVGGGLLTLMVIAGLVTVVASGKAAILFSE